MTQVDRTFEVNLTETEIAILKAALKYYVLDVSLGYAIWGETARTFGTSDEFYINLACQIQKRLEDLSKIEAHFGWWGDIDRMFQLGKKELNKIKREQKKIDEELDREYKLTEGFIRYINEHGLNGEEISKEVYEEIRKEWEAENKKNKGKKAI
ncbi:hypothetical protein A2858_02500 [Candidatus Daviesbacteria bacterium RIFCSPHIGHO2_01_FULL_36_37]|uniref:Uncharacterized protein n=3 Tax=Candidatus Daviesiibacteriota TaxID=1752718 RepID=A0A1F5K226_9BACT|nr:MAG: hypothetical protein US28_C0017G0006 [Candidatus Daviesbacteria bacterium GW2011_GWA1_36_8]OGE16684.1 MAG: hypothetical protein A2858_02500 [Candidatus Daviesbacteria bacterium RIFCSPHIGHO2_01_FULL_36_37]OGE34761.1 MAG: hypothetical protein A3E66_04020 [Candidatus Daviesbacteria bacterium RIFCSPHIGHO2_12_FULL_37_16]